MKRITAWSAVVVGIGLLAAGCSDESSQSDAPAPAPAATNGCVGPMPDAPFTNVGKTFTLDNRNTIIFDDDSDYHATLGGIAETGTYFLLPNFPNATISLMPTNGSPNSTLMLTFVVVNCQAKAGTYTIQETGRSGTFTVSP